jgi:hypothetical protein
LSKSVQRLDLVEPSPYLRNKQLELLQQHFPIHSVQFDQQTVCSAVLDDSIPIQWHTMLEQVPSSSGTRYYTVCLFLFPFVISNCSNSLLLFYILPFICLLLFDVTLN